METLGLFISLAFLMVTLLAVVVLIPWLRPQKANQADNRLMAINVQIFEDRLAELQADKSAGVLSEADYQTQKTDLQRQLLAAQTPNLTASLPTVKSRLIILIWLPILCIMAYLMVGDRTPVFTLWQAQDKFGQVADDLLTGKIDTPPDWATKDNAALISAMQTNVYHHAHDAQRWLRLSEIFIAMQATEPALEALSRAYRLDPTNDNIAMTYAQISFFGNGGNLNATARQALQDILTQNPQHEGAMMLMAMGETRAKNKDQAQYWINQLKQSIQQKDGDHSKALASLDELSASLNQAPKTTQNLPITVQIDPKLIPQIAPSDTLFITIRDTKGSAPYAVKRLNAQDLTQKPIKLQLSDQDAMMPNHTLTQARQQKTQLILTAKISKTGNAQSQIGDLESDPLPITDLTQAQTITINKTIAQTDDQTKDKTDNKK